MRDLVLLLTARCNLSCSYCYQAGRGAQPDMTWEVARAAIDRLLTSPPERALLAFSGGEPFLAELLFRRCVAYARERTPPPTELRIEAATNGTRAGDDLVRFLSTNDVALQVSYDGLGQERRAAGTEPDVSAALRRMAELEPSWFRTKVRVALTLTPETLPGLAASVESILRLGVRDVAVAAATAGAWPPGPVLEAELDRQLARVAAACTAFLPGWSGTPVALLREPSPRALPSEAEAWCRAAAPGSVAVDPAGVVWACPSSAASMQRLSPAGREISDALRVGRLTDPDLDARLAALPERARSSRALTHRRRKRSELAECGTCPHVAACTPCALAAARVPGGADPDLVPAVTCALTRAAARARAALPPRLTLGALLRDLERLSSALDQLGP